MDVFADRPWKVALRWVAVVLLATGAVVFSRSSPGGFLLSIPLVGLAAILALPELLRPVAWLVDALFGTGTHRGERPALDLRLARFYEREERWEEAIGEYERLLGFHPEVTELHRELMRLQAREKYPVRSIRRTYRRGLKRARTAEERSALTSAWETALTTRAGQGGGPAGGKIVT